MSRLAKWKAEQHKEIIKASNAKPEKPRIQDQLVLDKNLLDMQKSLTADDKKIDDDMYGELSEKWKGNGGGGSGDAFITGLSAGLRKGESSEEKEKTKKIMKFNQQMSKMVSEQNIQLFEAEKLDKARLYVEPRIMSYLENCQKMSPNDRMVYLNSALEEYNESAGTNYKLSSIDGANPQKPVISDDGNLRSLDLMDFIKTPEQKKLEFYNKSNEVKQYEKELGQEDDLEREAIKSKISQNRNNTYDNDIKRKEHEEAISVEKEILEKNGDHVKFIDHMPTSGKTYAEKHIKEYTDKANQHLASEKRLTRAIQIAKDHPELFGNLNAIIASRYNENPGYLNNLFKNKIPEESMNAMSELSGIVKNIFTDSVKGVPAKGINQFIEKKLEAGSPNTRWTAESFAKVVGEALEENKDSYNEEKKVADYGSEGLYYRPRAKSRKESSSPKKESNTNMAEVEKKIKSIPGITNADYLEAVRRLQGGK